MDTKKVFIAGHKGFVGKWIDTILRRHKIRAITYPGDLREENAVKSFFARNKPDYVVMAAAKCGGIVDNMTYPVKYLLDNTQMQNNVISAAHESGCQNLIFLGSSCVYPKTAQLPFKEESILTGPFEPTNESYAIAKVAGQKLCQAYNSEYGRNYVTLHPCNLYGPLDNITESGHVVGALIGKFLHAHENNTDVTVLGSGLGVREFMYVEDFAKIVHQILMMMDVTPNKFDVHHQVMNIGTEEEIYIVDVVNYIRDIIGFRGKIEYDMTRPDGMNKSIDTNRMRSLGLKAETSFKEGLERTITFERIRRETCSGR